MGVGQIHIYMQLPCHRQLYSKLYQQLKLFLVKMGQSRAKIPAFSRECLKQTVAIVTVAFPATPLLLARIHICILAAHKREDLIKGLEVISKVGDLVGIKYFPAEPPNHQGQGRPQEAGSREIPVCCIITM
ncbi:hypothetical protein OPV22_032728 [Ensete ventricosum]|uniref:serine C-palmitoyltransferase n=1 Tax=Ensete ventricosum TaxID=4639 RepID=A0AAV8PW79_ENSVE|nr:hypothetical protein OPV22_032728 [Ensete ventricosum]